SLSLRHPPCLPLSPYTTLFRSPVLGLLDDQIVGDLGDLGHGLPGLADRGGGAVEHLVVARFQVDLRAEHRFVLRPVMPLAPAPRSEEHTSELQSRENLVCRLLL